jgi:hypothetical protein
MFAGVVVAGSIVPARSVDPREALWVRATACGVLVYYVTYVLLTDWPLWSWYKYPLGWGAVVACTRLARAEMRALGRAVLAGAVVFAALMFVSRFGHTPDKNLTYADAQRVGRFAAEHPGRWAMGDCSGSVGYALGDQPLLQTEGLVGDRELLALIRARTPLKDALARYRIDYYLAVHNDPKDGCYVVREPNEAGPDSPVMTGRICTQPLARLGEVDVFRASDVR